MEEDDEAAGFVSSWSIYENREVLARYAILDHIGSGAYSDVYHGKRREDGLHVALKEVHDPKSSARELAALKLLKGNSSHVVQLLDYFWLNPGILLVLEFLPNSLSEVIEKRKEKTIQDSEARNWMMQVLKAVEECHKAGVLHRDLKPSNLLISNDGVIKLADFGTARVLGVDSVQDIVKDELPIMDHSRSKSSREEQLERSKFMFGSGKRLENEEIEQWLQGGSFKLKETAASEQPECPRPIHISKSYERLEIEDSGTEVSPRVSDVDQDTAEGSEKNKEFFSDADAEWEIHSAKQSDSDWYKVGSDDFPGNLTDCVGTRWYKAPELLYGSTSYNFAVDMWAVGCILAELIQGEPVFPGSSDIDQLSRVVRILGVPNETIWPGVSELPDYDKICFNDNRQAVTLAKHLNRVSTSSLELLEKLLVYCPESRLSASEALRYLGNVPLDKDESRTKDYTESIERWLTGR